MIVKKFKGILQSYQYVSSDFQIVQGVQKGKKPKTSRGVVGRSRGHGNGEIIVPAKFLVAVDLGVQDDHWESIPPAIDIIDQLHAKWRRLTKNRQEALRAVMPYSVEVEGHCSNSGKYYYTISSESVNLWVEAAELYLSRSGISS